MMGDGGSYFLGSNLAVLSILSLTENSSHINLIPLFAIFLIPIIDMAYVIFSRIINGVSPFYPDRRHLHHRLMKMGFSHKKTVMIIYFLNFIVVFSSIKFLT